MACCDPQESNRALPKLDAPKDKVVSLYPRKHNPSTNVDPCNGDMNFKEFKETEIPEEEFPPVKIWAAVESWQKNDRGCLVVAEL